MTCEPAGWGWPGTAGPWPGSVVAWGVRCADDAVVAALRDLARAADVEWVAAAATGYRAALWQDTVLLRITRELVDRALAAAAEHDHAVDLARQRARCELAAHLFGVLPPGPVAALLYPGAW